MKQDEGCCDLQVQRTLVQRTVSTSSGTCTQLNFQFAQCMSPGVHRCAAFDWFGRAEVPANTLYDLRQMQSINARNLTSWAAGTPRHARSHVGNQSTNPNSRQLATCMGHFTSHVLTMAPVGRLPAWDACRPHRYVPARVWPPLPPRPPAPGRPTTSVFTSHSYFTSQTEQKTSPLRKSGGQRNGIAFERRCAAANSRSPLAAAGDARPRSHGEPLFPNTGHSPTPNTAWSPSSWPARPSVTARLKNASSVSVPYSGVASASYAPRPSSHTSMDSVA
jgi:hypothetical protein